MSNFLKSKLIIILGAMIILVFIPLFKSNFNAPVTFYKWKKLNWDDFQGFVKPITGWEAGISSSVYIDYDSIEARHVAYAAMNNQLSWKKSSSVESDYLLNHEQYHFNITEYQARKLNRIIATEKLQTETEILPKLSLIRSELSRLQDEYDTESNHSINRDLQRKWEYRIDSLLGSFEEDSGYVIDHYSGGAIHMPSDFNFTKGIHEDQSTYRIFELKRYDMNLAMTSFQYISLAVESMTEGLTEYYKNDSLKIVNFNIDTALYDYQARIEAYDSIKQETTFHLWVHHDGYLYKITASFPGNSVNSAYRSIANSFTNSFKIIDTKEYWLDKFRNSDSDIFLSSTTPLNTDKKDGENKLSKCATYAKPKQYGFHGRPIFREDGSFLLPFNIVEHADSLIQEVMLLYNDGWYSYELESEDQIFFIPEENLKGDLLSINFGYLLKQDSVKECYTFYYQNLEINRQIIGAKNEPASPAGGYANQAL